MWQQVKERVGLSPPPRKRSLASKTPPPCSDLYDLVLDLDWDRVIQHCRDHPQDAHFQEGDGLETPLYLACQWHPPLQAIQALIQANPAALQWTSREHRDLPLHMICRYPTTSIQLLKEFVTPFPSAACRTTKYGKTPLQVLWQFARPECMKDPPLVSPVIRTEEPPTEEEQEEQVNTFWDKMDLLVQAVARSRQQSWPVTDQALYKVHAVVSLGALGCPCEVLEHVCDRYPEQLRQRDESGQLPLHLAVGPTQWSGRRKYKPRELKIIQLLLQRYPDAARMRLFSLWDYYDKSSGKRRPHTTWSTHTSTQPTMDRSGRYPLHIALANRHSWDGGVADLFRAAPEVLSLRDPVTRLYSFQLAAMPVQDNLVVDLTTIVELVMQKPDLISLCTANTARMSNPQSTEDGDVTNVSEIDSLKPQQYSKHTPTNDPVRASPSKYTSSSLYLSRQEDENTLLIGLGVAVAVGTGLLCWRHYAQTAIDEDNYTAPGRHIGGAVA